MEITEDEHVHDSKMLPWLIDEIVKTNGSVLDKLLAGGTYDNNDIFRFLSEWDCTMYQGKKECEDRIEKRSYP